MPLYGFHCDRCGPFEEWRPLSEASSPSRCPTCGGPGRRLYSAPGLVRTPAAVRQARNLEERSAHEPEVVQGSRSSLPGRPLRRGPSTTPPWATPKAVPTRAGQPRPG
jgi:putative FmdB family regulatory protein